MVPDEQSHGLSNILQHKIEIPTILGQGAPSFRKRLSQNVPSLSQHASPGSAPHPMGVDGPVFPLPRLPLLLVSSWRCMDRLLNETVTHSFTLFNPVPPCPEL